MSSSVVPTLVGMPSSPPRGIVVVLHDIFGLSDYVEQVIADLNAAGWAAVAPALFHREGLNVVPYDDLDSGSHASSTLTGQGVIDDIDNAITQIIAAGAPSDSGVAVIGFCLGGLLATFVATERTLLASVNFYGGIVTGEGRDIPSTEELIPSVMAPWLSIYGESDPFIPNDEVEQLRAGLDRCPAPAVLSTFPGGHAFHRFTTPDYYHEESALVAWGETLAWLDAPPGATT